MALTKPEDIDRFLRGGRAIFTISNRKSGNRFTYQVRRYRKQEQLPSGTQTELPTTYRDANGWKPAKTVVVEKPVLFVRVLTGPENTSDYTFIGSIFDDGPQKPRYVHSQKSRISEGAPSAYAFRWFTLRLWSGQANPFPEGFEFRHEGRCGRCARVLTVPESIDSGFGPECIGRVGEIVRVGW